MYVKNFLSQMIDRDLLTTNLFYLIIKKKQFTFTLFKQQVYGFIAITLNCMKSVNHELEEIDNMNVPMPIFHNCFFAMDIPIFC